MRTERDVVAEERLGDVEDSVDGTLDETDYGQAFKRHPYRWPVIGRMTDIKAVTRDKATRFYKTFYAPNNAVVVVAGRFDAERGAGDHRRAATAASPPSPNLPADTTAPERAPAAGDPPGHRAPGPGRPAGAGLPRPGLGDARPRGLRGAGRDPHRRPLGAAAPAAGGGERRSPPRWTPAPRATRDPGLYALWVQMRKGHRADEAEKLIDQRAAGAARQAGGRGRPAQGQNRIETAFWRALASSEGRANQLGEFEVVAGDYRKLFEPGRRRSPA